MFGKARAQVVRDPQTKHSGPVRKTVAEQVQSTIVRVERRVDDSGIAIDI
jgi:hypothetical protein